MSMSASEAEVALTNTAHLYARVSEKERLLRFFTEVLGLSPREVSVAYVTAKKPMYAVTFSNGAAPSSQSGGRRSGRASGLSQAADTASPGMTVAAILAGQQPTPVLNPTGNRHARRVTSVLRS